MFREFFRFELRYQLRSPLIWIAALVLGLMAFGAMTSDSISIGGGIGNVHRNAPSVVLTFMAVFSVIGLFLAVAFIAQPLLRDFDLGADELFFSTPFRKGAYLWGRTSAAALAALVVYVVAALAMIVGGFMPWLDPARLGPFSFTPYAWVFGVIVIPNMLFTAALLALLAVTTRRLLLVFLGAIAFLVLWMVAGALTRDIQYDTLASMMDPFGARAIARITRYWSVAERNTQLPELTGLLLWNRALWLGVAVTMAAAAHALFRPQRPRPGASKKRALASEAASSGPLPREAGEGEGGGISAARPLPARGAIAFRQFLKQLSFDASYVLKSIPFLVLVAFGLFNFIGGARTIDSSFGTEVYPVTGLMIEALQGSYQFLLIIVVTFYAGDILWRERDAKLAEVHDALPVPNWVPLLAKLGALAAVVVAFMLCGALAGVGFQLWNGYTNLEIGLYLRSTLIESLPFVLMAMLAVFLQVLSNQKFLGYFLLIVVLIAQIVTQAMNFEHNLYQLGAAPILTYSDMNGYGHLLAAWGWFQAYWALFFAMLIVLASAFWVRGVAPSFGRRVRNALASLRGPSGALLAAFALAFVAVGGWIFYNTNVLNEYVPSDAFLDRQAAFEKNYRQYLNRPQPRIVDVRTNVDLYPEERRAVVRGHYRLVNKHAQPIDELHVVMNPEASLEIPSLAAAALTLNDAHTGFRIYRLAQPLAPGAALDFEFVVTREERGFTNSGMPPSTGPGDLRSPLNYNGTFFNSNEMLPHLGYSEDRQIIDRNERRKRDLGPVPRMAKLEDESARGSMGFADADWINFEATVSTSADQIALAPGYLQREWTEGDRRYFHYKMDRPMLPYFCFLSARWDVKRGEWRGLPIEVYYDPAHPYNVDRMITASQKSLDYFTAHFSPYQHQQVRILEFPRYARFAQSFANTIPFSESIGFIADLRDPDDIDGVFYVTAHEVAHQWWAHQAIGADVQGSTMIVESLAQYSALMVMEKEYGREHMRRFLKYELDRYLSGRGGELIEELPLMRVENQQYIHYAKGSLVFYRLREEIGEENLNRALANFIRDKAFQSPPYTTTREMLDYIRAETPADRHRLIEELFAKIVFYDNRVVAARSRKLDDGKYAVEIDFEAAKRESDGEGAETDMALDDWMQVGVFARAPGEEEADEKVLYLEPHHIAVRTGTLKLVVDGEPYEVGLDPYNKLIDRIPVDNRKTLN